MNTNTNTGVNAYRGLGVGVDGNNAKAILAKAGLDWRVIQLPMAVVGQREVRLVPDGRVNVRSDSGAVLSFSSSDYKPHQNAELVGMMAEFANECGITLTHVGSFNGGARIWASADAKVEGEAKVGDVVGLRIVMRSGHEPGVATTVSASAFRLACGNGATVRVAGGRAKFTHSSGWSEMKVGQARAYVNAAKAGFSRHMDRLKAVYAAHTSRALDLTYLIQLIQPELLTPLTMSVHGIHEARTPDAKVANTRLLNAILDADSSRRVVESLIEGQGSRTLKAVVEAYDHQPGAAFSVGTLAHAYNGVTHFNSNLRGRTTETGVESNYWGEAAKSTARALDLAIEYTAALTATATQTFI
jgi:hypothetical protein